MMISRGSMFGLGLRLVCGISSENSATASAHTTSQKSAPKLILHVTVDQLRGDLPRRYLKKMPPGSFRYLMDQGVVYEDAHLAANTGTLVGHATLAAFVGASRRRERVGTFCRGIRVVQCFCTQLDSKHPFDRTCEERHQERMNENPKMIDQRSDVTALRHDEPSQCRSSRVLTRVPKNSTESWQFGGQRNAS